MYNCVCVQVFDRLQRLGLTSAYTTSLNVIDCFNKDYITQLIDVLASGKTFRLVGDNINWHTKISDQRFHRSGGMTNAFTSAAIVQEVYFPEMSSERRLEAVPIELYMLGKDDICVLKDLYVRLVLEVIETHLKSISWVSTAHEPPVAKHAERLKSQTTVYPLPVLYLNEQKNSDVVQIMSWYQNLVELVHEKAGKTLERVHVGGDQLTRVRFSAAKRGRATGTTPSQRFDNLGPITFEFFHLQMKALDYMYKVLFTDRSSGQKGTMFNSKVKLRRTNVSSNSYHTFDDNKDFAISFTDAYIVECLMHFLAMADVNATPQSFNTSHGTSEDDKRRWLKFVVALFVDNYLLGDSVKGFTRCSGWNHRG